MTLRPFLMMLVALAMAFAPFAVQGGAMAMPSGHDRMAMDEGHCGDEPAEDDGSAASDSCCTAMCTAIAAAPASGVEAASFARSIERPAPDRFGRSFLAELPTPPPRGA